MPTILAEDGVVRLKPLIADGVRRFRTDRGRVVADIVIAGQIAAGDWKRFVQRFGECEVVWTGRRIERHVAAVDDEIGPLGIDMFAETVEIIGQRGVACREVRIGNLDQAKFTHAINPSVEIYLHCELEMMNSRALSVLIELKSMRP